MYICICNAIKDKDVQRVSCECKSVKDVFKQLDCSPCCGKCVPELRGSLLPAKA